MKVNVWNGHGKVDWCVVESMFRRVNIDSTDLSRDGIELDPFSAPLAAEITAEVVTRSLTLNMAQEFGAGHLLSFIG
jgi:hypothetical protein